MGLVTYARPEQRDELLPKLMRGELLFALGLTENQAGSDAAAIRTTATRTQSGWCLDGHKTWISNGGIADVYTVFARTGEAPGAKGMSAFILPAGTGPNAIAWATGRLTIPKLLRAGLVLDLVGIFLIVGMIWGISALT